VVQGPHYYGYESLIEFPKATGAERKNAVISEKNRKMVAYHEAGHALVAIYTPGAMSIHKATIMPRGPALGMVSQLPDGDELNWTRKQLLARLDVAMGGRCSEELIFGAEEISSGASSDINSATNVARSMVTKFGMGSSTIGPVMFEKDDYYTVSSQTRQAIEGEVKKMLDDAYIRAMNILKTKSVELDRLAKALLEYETLNKDEIELVIQGKPLPRTPEGNGDGSRDESARRLAPTSLLGPKKDLRT
jgi:ATP-dependent metalloprotease